MKPKILIGSTLFDERKNYQEVLCARAFALLGCEVLIVCARHFPSAESPPWRVEVIEKHVRVRDTIFFPRGLNPIVSTFQPHAAFLFAPNHGLPYALLRHLPRGCKAVPVFGDLRESHHGRRGKWLTVRGNPLFKRLVKDRWYRNLMKQADLILAVTNETVRILCELDKASWEKKGWMCGLSADPAVFHWDGNARSPGAKEKMLITITRVIPEKPVREWVRPVLRFLHSHPDWHYTLAGMPEGPEGQALSQELLAEAPPGQLHLLPLQSPARMNDLFNRADMAVWFLPSIGIQQSMITGLPVVLPQAEAVNHLMDEGVNGLYYRSSGELEETLDRAARVHWDRAAIVRRNSALSSTDLFRAVLQRLGLTES